MKRVDDLHNTAFGLEKSSADANRFYSILLDAREVKTSANMCDIAEKLVLGEKENAKTALEQLWALKKNLLAGANGTIDLLIDFYQEKINVLRTNEEHIKKVSKDSRGLLEEKRRKDEEIASVKQQIGDCTREIKDLNDKLEKLTVREQELSLIEQQLKKELDVNENEIVNGLYEIILTQPEGSDLRPPRKREESDADPSTRIELSAPQPESSMKNGIEESTAVLGAMPSPPPPFGPPTADDLSRLGAAGGDTGSRPAVREEKPPFPRSVVKTTRGRVIGEYYYDGSVEKNARHYIFNSKFFASSLSDSLLAIRTKFDQGTYTEMLQTIQDAYKRITDGTRLHFEISTNEILNEKTLKQLWLDAKTRSFDEVERFCARLLAKIETMGQNYRAMVREQMERCVKEPS